MRTSFPRPIRRSLLLALMLSGATAAYAAEPDPVAADQNARTDDEVVVLGVNDRSLEGEEEQVVGTLDVVQTGDVALQSQTNIADLAKQLPGVSISHDQGRNQSATGEAQYASIRGFETGFNAYTLDGLRLPQTAGGSTRAISLNLFSPFAIGGIVADKTPGADRDADAIAGIIDLRTPSAFDFADGFVRTRLLTQIAQRALQQGQEGVGGAAGVDMAQRFGNDGQFGIYLAGYYERRANVAESVATQNPYKTTLEGADGRAEGTELSADGIQWNFFNSEIERYGASGSLDFRSEPVDLYARVNWARYDNTNTMDQTGLRNELVSGQTNPNGGAYNDAGVFTPLGINPAHYFRVEDVEQELFSAQLGGRVRAGRMSFGLAGSYADGRLDQPTSHTAAFRGIPYINTPGQMGAAQEGLQIDLSNPKWPQAILSPGAAEYVASLQRPQQYYVQSYQNYLSEDKLTFKGDVDWTGDGVLAQVKLGGLWERSERAGRTLDSGSLRYRFQTDLYSGTVPGLPLSQFPGEVLDNFMGHQTPRPIKLVNRAAIEDQVRRYVNFAGLTASEINTGLLDGEEKRAAVFANATLRIENDKIGTIEIVPGIRYEDNSYSARYWLEDADGDRFVNAGRDYDHIDPSLLAVWRAPGGWTVRGAARRSYSRPAFNQLAGPTSVERDAITDEIISISSPNPNLKPVEAWNFDAGVEYRAGPNRWFQLAAYYKDLKNVIVPTATREGGNTVDGIIYYTPYNGLGGSAKGIEASFRFALGDWVSNPWLGGFGLGGNITVQDTEVTYQLDETEVRTGSLPEAPGLIANAQLFYDHGPLRAQLWYNHIGRRLISVEDALPDIYAQPLDELNFGIAYSLNDHLELGFSARNLTDAPSYYTTIGKSTRYISHDRSGGYLKVGRIFQASLTMKM
jgi:TonB-dependent receptor